MIDYPKLTIREIYCERPADWEVARYISLIEAVGWAERSTHEMTLAISKSLAVFFVYTEGTFDDVSVALGACRIVGDGIFTAVLYDLVVHPEFRRSGVGSLLLQSCVEWVRTRTSVANLELICSPGAEIFYRRADWRGRETLAFTCPVVCPSGQGEHDGD